MTDDMPPHEFVDHGVLRPLFPGDSSYTCGRPVCSWNEDGQGECDRYRDDPIHRVVSTCGGTTAMTEVEGGYR